MSEEIILEVKFFLISIVCGILMLIVYDILRILRRVIKHPGYLVALEDLLFWISGSFFIFTMIYKENYGILRSFSILGMVLGMVFYHNLVGDFLAEGISKGINWILKMVAGATGFMTAPFRIIVKKLKNPMKYCIRGLKKKLKTVKIALTKK